MVGQFFFRSPGIRLLIVLMFVRSAQADIQGDGWQVVQPQGVVAPAVVDVPDPAVDAPQPPDPAGAEAAMLAIDPKYVNGIVLVTARNGTPQPKQWVVVARDSDDLGTLHKLTVADAQVIADVQSMNAYESFRQDVAINPVSVQVDSGAAFQIAQPIAAANNKIIGHVDYALTIRGTDASPIWTLNCFDINGGFLGKVVLLATTGAVLSQPGFRNSPAQ
ncbi:MAG: hypothetical protein Fur0032_11030 [Terrimicrobiaceae bacterium]